MKLMKRLTAGALAMLLAFSVVGCADKAKKDTTDKGSKTTQVEKKDDMTVVAKVGEESIYQRDIDRELPQFKETMAAQYGEDYLSNEQVVNYINQQENAALNYLVEKSLLNQKATSLKFAATEKEVNAEYDRVRAQYKTEEEWKKALDNVKVTEEDLKANIKITLDIQKYITEINKDITVSDEEIKTYYDANIASFTSGAGADIAHILVKTEEEAKKVKKEYVDGATFEDLAAKYGTDGTATKGGQLGFISYDTKDYDQDFMAGAKGLKEGEVSDPVKSQFGYHLIKVTNVKAEATVKPLKEVKEQIKTQLLNQKQQAKISETIKELKKVYKVEILRKDIPVQKKKETTKEKKSDTTTGDTTTGDTKTDAKKDGK